METGNLLEELNAEEAKQYVGGVIFVTILMVIGIVGNVHVLWIYAFQMKPSNHRIFILMLGVLDFITCCVGMPFIIVDLRNPLTFKVVSICKIMRFNNYFICTSSVLVLLVIAVERYRKICVPLGRQITQTFAKGLCLLVFGIALILSWPAPVLYGGATVNTTQQNITGTRCYTEDKFVNTKYQAYFNAMLILIVFGIFIILIVIYSFIGRIISKHNTFKSNIPVAHASDTSSSVNQYTPSTDRSEISDGLSSASSKKYAHSQTKNAICGNMESSKKPETNIKCVFTIAPAQTFNKEISGRKKDQPNTSPKRTRRTTLMFFLITVVFFISYIPHLLLKLVTFMNKSFVSDMSFTGKVLYNTFVWCFFINNMANSFIYGFCDGRFRSEVRAMYSKLSWW